MTPRRAWRTTLSGCGEVWENLDFARNVGRSIEKRPSDRKYVEAMNRNKLCEVQFFTFEPHVCRVGRALGVQTREFSSSTLIEESSNYRCRAVHRRGHVRSAQSSGPARIGGVLIVLLHASECDRRAEVRGNLERPATGMTQKLADGGELNA